MEEGLCTSWENSLHECKLLFAVHNNDINPRCLSISCLKNLMFFGNIYKWFLLTFSLLMLWVLLMSAQVIQNLKDKRQAWQFRLWAYCGIFGEWKNGCMEITVVVVATLIDVQNFTIVLLQNSVCKRIYCQILHFCNEFFNYCFLSWFNFLLINGHFFY